MRAASRIIAALGFVFDIRDMGALTLWLIFAGGGAAVITGVANEARGFSVTTLVLIGGGSFLMLLAVLPNAWRFLWRAKWAQPEYLSQSYLRGVSIRITDLARDDPTIRNRTFEDCHIYGPAVLVLLAAEMLQECGFEGDTSAILLRMSDEQERIIGAIGIENCVFRRCRFKGIGIASTSEGVEHMKKGFMNA